MTIDLDNVFTRIRPRRSHDRDDNFIDLFGRIRVFDEAVNDGVGAHSGRKFACGRNENSVYYRNGFFTT